MDLFDEPKKKGTKRKKTGGKVKGSPDTRGPTCGAKSKQTGNPCKKPAGWGTKHLGEGRCKLHGGTFRLKNAKNTQLRNPENIARVGVENLRALGLVIANTENGNALARDDINAEIKTLRTLKAAQEIEIFYRITEDGGVEPISEEEILKKIRSENPVVKDLVEVSDKIGSLLAKKARIKAQEAAFTADDVTRLIMKIGRMIQKYVPDGSDQEALWSEIEALSIRIGPKADIEDDA